MIAEFPCLLRREGEKSRVSLVVTDTGCGWKVIAEGLGESLVVIGRRVVEGEGLAGII